MTKPNNSQAVKPTPEVEDPHPGSISNGTHPSAMEHKQPKRMKADDPVARPIRTRNKPDLKEGQTRVNTEAPRHPNKAASGS